MGLDDWIDGFLGFGHRTGDEGELDPFHDGRGKMHRGGPFHNWLRSTHPNAEANWDDLSAKSKQDLKAQFRAIEATPNIGHQPPPPVVPGARPGAHGGGNGYGDRNFADPENNDDPLPKPAPAPMGRPSDHYDPEGNRRDPYAYASPLFEQWFTKKHMDGSQLEYNAALKQWTDQSDTGDPAFEAKWPSIKKQFMTFEKQKQTALPQTKYEAYNSYVDGLNRANKNYDAAAAQFGEGWDGLTPLEQQQRLSAYTPPSKSAPAPNPSPAPASAPAPAPAPQPAPAPAQPSVPDTTPATPGAGPKPTPPEPPGFQKYYNQQAQKYMHSPAGSMPSREKFLADYLRLLEEQKSQEQKARPPPPPRRLPYHVAYFV